MEQRVVICFFMLKGLKVMAIHTAIKSVSGPEAFALPAVKKLQRRFHQERMDLLDNFKSGPPLTNGLAAMGSMLEERPFSSCKMFCRHMIADPSRQAWFERFHLRWVPHALSVNQKGERVSYSKFLLMALMEQKASGFQRTITRDES
jgi:hypothetical protein